VRRYLLSRSRLTGSQFDITGDQLVPTCNMTNYVHIDRCSLSNDRSMLSIKRIARRLSAYKRKSLTKGNAISNNQKLSRYACFFG